MSGVDNAPERELFSIVEKRSADGAFVYSDDELAAVLPVLMLGIARAFPDAELPAHAVEAIGALARTAGVQDGDAPEAIADKVRAHVESMQVGRRLLDELERVMRGALGSGNQDAALAAAKALGVDVHLRPLGDGARPKDSVAGGPLARFAALGKVPPKK